MEKSVFKYILRYSARQQVWLMIVSAASFPFLYLFYELPKNIINNAIIASPERFPVELFGVEFGHIQYLLTLCIGFLILVIINQGFKYYINVYKGLTGERMLRRLRYDLFARVLRFPLPTFRNMSQGEIIPMITQEVEPLGGFVGDAYSLPAFQGGQLLVILAFLFVQNPIMAAAAVSLYPLQVYIIPKLQSKVNKLGKERVRLVRKLSERIGESVQGAQEVHVHDTSNRERSDFGNRLGDIFDVRYQIYRKKFVIKFINNFIQQLGPFFFYSLGGYLVITGGLDIGTLMAAIAAHKDLAAPWKELLRYYQMMEDSRIKYEQVIVQFQPAGMRDADYQMKEPDTIAPLTGEMSLSNLTMLDDQDVAVVDGVNATLELDKSIAIVGGGGSGRESIAMLLARLLDPNKGRISIGGNDISSFPEAITGRRMSYIGQGGHVFSGSLGDNLFYGLKHRPISDNPDEKLVKQHKARASEAKASGNSEDDYFAQWIDYDAAGADGPESLTREGLRVLKMVGLDEEVYQFGLRGAIDPVDKPEVAEAILRARTALREHAKGPGMADLIETFDRDKYNANATVAENLVFGNTVGDAFDMDKISEHPYVLSILEKSNLTHDFVQMGHQVAATMVELFADLPADHEFFQQFSFISSEYLPEYQAILNRSDRDNLDQLSDEDRAQLLALPFLIIPARHRLGLIDESFQARILQARAMFSLEMPDDLRASVEFYQSDNYISAANLQDNILFGKIAYGQAEAAASIGSLISDVIQEENLYDIVVEVGFGFDVGVGGARLTTAQRQKLVLARSIIKRPDVLILSEATAALDASVEAAIMKNILDEYAGRSVIWALQHPELAKSFDHVIVMSGGEIAEQGTYAQLKESGKALPQLIDAHAAS